MGRKRLHSTALDGGWRDMGKRALLIALPVLAFFLALSLGRYPVNAGALLGALRAQVTGAEMDAGQLALVRVRLPRVLLAMVVGASLSLSGAVYQGLFKNPVVSPDLLGASSGALARRLPYYWDPAPPASRPSPSSAVWPPWRWWWGWTGCCPGGAPPLYI